jgi:hypothetical protein
MLTVLSPSLFGYAASLSPLEGGKESIFAAKFIQSRWKGAATTTKN